jgi:hypothetical protein
MNRATQIFLTCPALLASMLLAHNPAFAAEVTTQPTDTAASTKPVFEVVFERPTAASPTSDLSNTESDDALKSEDCGCSGETPTFNFTDQESEAAIKRYGCECAGCINAVRQLQGKLPLL